MKILTDAKIFTRIEIQIGLANYIEGKGFVIELHRRVLFFLAFCSSNC